MRRRDDRTQHCLRHARQLIDKAEVMGTILNDKQDAPRRRPKPPPLLAPTRHEQQQADRAYFASRINVILARKTLRARKCSTPFTPSVQLPLIHG